VAEEMSLGARAKRTAVRIGVVLVVLVMGVAVFQLLSQLNARTFTIRQEGELLVVHKGRAFPAGSEPYHPSDPLLADTYAPIPSERLQVGALLERRFTDRDELDRALFDVLEKLARPKLYSDESVDLDRGLYFVRRAEKLKGLTEEQRAALKGMQSELSYYLARTRLDDARRQLAEAMAQLQIAADSNDRNARSAHQMLLEVREPGKALEEALRRAVHSLSTPAKSPDTPAAPAPAPAAPAPAAPAPVPAPAPAPAPGGAH
jgi:hypothetical protein